MTTHLVGLAEDGTWFRHADGDTYFGARTAKMEPEPPAALTHHDTEAMLGYVLPVLFALSLMHCRNVEIRTVEPDPEASRAHRRRHHHRLVRYQVLDIEPMRRILDQAGAADPQAGGLRRALTICRGHFKTFTPDAPLFGKQAASSGGRRTSAATPTGGSHSGRAASPTPDSRRRSGRRAPVGQERPRAVAARRRRLPRRRPPPTAATSEQKTVISRLMTAKQRLTAGTPDDIKASVAASRGAVELLRTMRPATVNSVAAQRGLAEREAVIADKMTELAQALFSYDSAASHTDPHLRDIAWRRENAVLALGTATSLAQLIFART